MKKRFGSLVMIGISLIVALVTVIQAGTTPTVQRGTDAEFRALIDCYYVEWSKNDPDSCSALR